MSATRSSLRSPLVPAAVLLALSILPPTARADYLGNSESYVHEFGYCDGPTQGQPMPFLEIEVQGLGAVLTDADGNWSIAGSGGPRSVTCGLEGSYIHVYRNMLGPLAGLTAVAEEGVPLTVRFGDFNAQQDERNVFDAVNDVHAFISRFDPDFGYTNQQILATVGIDIYCGAYWDGELHFFRESIYCVNGGELEQVVHHEYGYGVQDYILGGWQGNEGLGEGNADVLGNIMTLDSAIARGLLPDSCETGVRDSDNELVYPDDVIGQDPYTAGSVIAGFHWDALVLLQARYGQQEGRQLAGELWHFGRILAQPDHQPDQVLATFLADDDDGDLSNGTPNHDILCEAAGNHGFECPEIDLTAVAGGAPTLLVAELGQNLPNPFNPRTEIRFRQAAAGPTRLAVYDAGGRLIRVLADGRFAAGEHRLIWDGADAEGRPVASGVYLYRLEMGALEATRKMTLLR
jgi:hypothetical protein